MTPELKIACEVVFQEHKVSRQPIKWSRDYFRGRISIGLSEMAKETLVKKNIIVLPDKTKKVFTELNPDVAAAGNFEEAEKIIATKVPGSVTKPAYDANTYITNHVYGFAASSLTPVSTPNSTSAAISNKPLLADVSRRKTVESKWWIKPIYMYILWPVCGAVGGILISFLLNFFFTEIVK